MTYQHFIPVGVCLTLGLFCRLARSWGRGIIDDSTGEPVDWERDAAFWFGCGIICLLAAFLAALASAATGSIPPAGGSHPPSVFLLPGPEGPLCQMWYLS